MSVPVVQPAEPTTPIFANEYSIRKQLHCRRVKRKSYRFSLNDEADNDSPHPTRRRLNFDAVHNEIQCVDNVDSQIRKPYALSTDIDLCYGNECSICLMIINNPTQEDYFSWIARLKCTHYFHNECILKWFSKNNQTCPCCRMVVL